MTKIPRYGLQFGVVYITLSTKILNQHRRLTMKKFISVIAILTITCFLNGCGQDKNYKQTIELIKMCAHGEPEEKRFCGAIKELNTQAGSKQVKTEKLAAAGRLFGHDWSEVKYFDLNRNAILETIEKSTDKKLKATAIEMLKSI